MDASEPNDTDVVEATPAVVEAEKSSDVNETYTANEPTKISHESTKTEPISSKIDANKDETEEEQADQKDSNKQVEQAHTDKEKKDNPPPTKSAPIDRPKNPATNNSSNNISNQTETTDENDILHTMSFNQDGGCLAVGTGSGFRICNVHPFQETIRRRLDGGCGDGAGIAQIEMLYRTNLLALTGTSGLSSLPSQFPPHTVTIYDDHDHRTIGQLVFRQKVIAAKLRRDRIIVVLRDRIYIYNFSDFGLLDKVYTGDNARGLVGISFDNGGVGGSTVERAEDILGVQGGGERNGLVLACPSTQRGQVRVELYGLRRTTFVDAHESALGALALSVDGSLLATASERGTVIRLFDTRGVTVGGGRTTSSSGTRDTSSTSLSSSIPLREFRRGVERATISCLTFSLDSCWLAAASDHGTVHIFQSQDPIANNISSEISSQKSISSMTGKAIRMLPKIVVSPTRYLVDGEQSVAQIRGIPHPRTCAFVPDRDCTIAVAGEDEYGNGCLLLAEFGKAVKNNTSTSKAGECIDESEAKRLSYHRFFKKDGAAAMHGKTKQRRNKSKDWKAISDLEEETAFIKDDKIDLRMNHITVGDDEDGFLPINVDTNN